MSKMVRCNKWRECHKGCYHSTPHKESYLCNDDCYGQCLPIPTKKKKKVCEWRECKDDTYVCGCSLTRYGYFSYTYCPFCGLKIKLVKEGK